MIPLLHGYVWKKLVFFSSLSIQCPTCSTQERGTSSSPSLSVLRKIKYLIRSSLASNTPAVTRLIRNELRCGNQMRSGEESFLLRLLTCFQADTLGLIPPWFQPTSVRCLLCYRCSPFLTTLPHLVYFHHDSDDLAPLGGSHPGQSEQTSLPAAPRLGENLPYCNLCPAGYVELAASRFASNPYLLFPAWSRFASSTMNTMHFCQHLRKRTKFPRKSRSHAGVLCHDPNFELHACRRDRREAPAEVHTT